jgi:hypothetical protein
MDSPRDTACAVGCPIRRSEDQRALAPPLGFSQRATSFIASRCQGIHQMPFMCRARAQPRARGVAACRDQMAEIRGQMASRPAVRPTPCCSDLQSLISDLLSCAQAPPRRCAHAPAAHTHAQVQPHPEGRWPDLLHGHDSLHNVKRAEIRGRRSETRSRTGPPGPRALPTSAFDIRLVRTPFRRPGCQTTRDAPACGRTASDPWPDTI